jgi:hypothetical protein
LRLSGRTLPQASNVSRLFSIDERFLVLGQEHVLETFKENGSTSKENVPPAQGWNYSNQLYLDASLSHHVLSSGGATQLQRPLQALCDNLASGESGWRAVGIPDRAEAESNQATNASNPFELVSTHNRSDDHRQRAESGRLIHHTICFCNCANRLEKQQLAIADK